MATIVMIDPIIVTIIPITVTTMLIVSNKILTFLMYFPHRHPSLNAGSLYDYSYSPKGEPLSAMDNTHDMNSHTI